jgi:hypothetical protein
LPSFLVTVKPKRGPSPAFGTVDLARISIKKAGVDERRPPRTARNSARVLRVGRIGITASAREFRPGWTPLGPPAEVTSRPRGVCGLWRGGGREPADHRWSTCACESRGDACEQGGSAGTYVSRISPFESQGRAVRSDKLANCFYFPIVRIAAAPGVNAPADRASLRKLGPYSCRIRASQRKGMRSKLTPKVQ